MNYLQLVSRLRQEAGVSGTGPSTVIGQTGEMQRLVDWVNWAYIDIQNADLEWRYLVGSFTLTLTPGQAAYTPAEAGISTRFARWLPKSIRLRLTGPGDERLLEPVSYDEYRSIYLTGPQPQSRPVAVSVTPDQKLAFGYLPNLAYTVYGEYIKTPQELTADADEPEMPTQFHSAIVYRALMLYARYESAGEIYQDAYDNYRRIMSQLRNDQGPTITLPESLV